MKGRSLVHMLSVAANRLEQDGANAKLITDLRDVAAREVQRRIDGRYWTEEEDLRVDAQRTLFNALPTCAAKDALKNAMLQRAYDLMWDGGNGVDAITEFLPSLDVEAMFDAWEDDSLGKLPRSHWYERLPKQ